MKKFWLLCTLCLSILSIFSMNGQPTPNYAGPNKVVCSGECVEIGRNENSDCKYLWTPDQGFMNPNDRTIPNPTVCPTQTTTYTITVVDDENTYTDQVTVSVGSVDLKLFKPEILAGNTTTMIPQGSEENVGGMTFVNLDNDDNDDEYDNTDGNVTGGDDELMKLVVETTPVSNVHMQTVRLNAISGGQNIRIWKNNQKSNGQYNLGSTLNLSPQNGKNRTVLWIEGITSHNNQRETVLELEVVSNDVVCETDRVAITVIGIQGITWQGIGNGHAPNSNPQHTNNELDHNDPNLPATAAPTLSYRVFPGARSPDYDAPNDIVELHIGLSVAPIEDISLHLKTFDIDDPFVENILPGAGPLLDPNDLGVGGTYSGGADIHYTPENDNRGEIVVGDPSTKAGIIMNTANNNIQNADNIATITIPSGTNNTTLHFKVSHHPGDNYRVAANTDLDFVQNLRNTDESHGIDIWDMNATSMIQEPLHYASHILTVWRILHVESESMSDYNWTYTFNSPVQQRLSLLNDFDGVMASETQRVYCGGQISQFDGSPNLSGGGGNGRFESGQMIIGLENIGGNYTPTPNSHTLGPLTLTPAGNVSTIRGNGNAMIEFTNQESIVPIFGEVTNPTGGVIQVTITEIEKNGGGFTYQVTGIPNGIPLASLVREQIKVGGGSNRTIAATSNNGGIIRLITNSALSIPFLIRDDDNFPATNVLPHQPNLVGLNTAFQDAYIICENDGGGSIANNNNNTSFIENASTVPHMNLINAQRQSAVNESPFFWVVYVTSAWQFSALSDGDPNGEDIHWGGTYPSTNTNHDTDIAVGGDYSYTYRETILDVPPPLAEHLIIAHEVGHQFGLDHGDVTGLPIPEFPNIGLMSAGGNNAGVAPTNRFIARHLNLIRSRVNSPGE